MVGGRVWFARQREAFLRPLLCMYVGASIDAPSAVVRKTGSFDPDFALCLF